MGTLCVEFGAKSNFENWNLNLEKVYLHKSTLPSILVLFQSTLILLIRQNQMYWGKPSDHNSEAEFLKLLMESCQCDDLFWVLIIDSGCPSYPWSVSEIYK